MNWKEYFEAAAQKSRGNARLWLRKYLKENPELLRLL